ncbi:hypothetical protein CMCT_1268 [Campylobacter mucosalis]|uniref:hypothetical protein n=1 Tax=Campylobacter mucosalis TaxID=202 RepID=UPI00068D31CD|nr:hypothetical protein [Campylobacter mucosalis]QKF63390.1 hypothetical protein CMCT_1268 [Campylobacter mucosalis]
MKITQNADILNKMVPNNAAKSDVKFDDILAFNVKQLEKEQNFTQEVEQFRKNLSKFGASGYLAKLNEEKIEQKVAIKRAELMEKMGLNSENLKNPDKAELNAILEELLAEYKKELLTQAQNNTILERAQKSYLTQKIAL